MCSCSPRHLLLFRDQLRLRSCSPRLLFGERRLRLFGFDWLHLFVCDWLHLSSCVPLLNCHHERFLFLGASRRARFSCERLDLFMCERLHLGCTPLAIFPVGVVAFSSCGRVDIQNALVYGMDMHMAVDFYPLLIAVLMSLICPDVSSPCAEA